MTISEFIPKKEVAHILGISVSTVFRWSNDGVLPQPVRLGPNKTMYVRSEIDAFLEKVKETRGFHGRGVDVK